MDTPTSQNDEVVLVTGACQRDGIGFAIGEELFSRGYKVVLTDLPADGETLSESQAEVAKTLDPSGQRTMALPLDVSSEESVRLCFAKVRKAWGSVSILVNNAGVAIGSANFQDNSDEEWSLTLAVNVEGTARVSRHFLSQCTEKQEAIVNVSSLSGLGAIESIPAPYTSSKFAVIGLTKAIALEYANRGVRCNAVCPGVVETAMRQTSLELISQSEGISTDEARAYEDSLVPMNRPASPSEVAKLVAFLASEDASYITGAALPVSGGLPQGL